MFEWDYIYTINMWKVFQILIPFSSYLIILWTVDFTCNLIFSHHLRFTTPSWKKENMRLKNGKVKTTLVLILTYDISGSPVKGQLFTFQQPLGWEQETALSSLPTSQENSKTTELERNVYELYVICFKREK